MTDGRRGFQDAKDQVKARLDLEAVVGETVVLRRSGRSYKGLCPFHDEKTPSFHVFPDSQHFKCFGCGEGGDVFTFVMKREGLGFGDALRLLAERAGVALPRQTARERNAARDRKGLLDVLSEAQAFFAEMLRGPAAEGARGYLDGRGLGAGIAKFALGYAPGPAAGEGGTRWPLVEFFGRQRLPVAAGIQLGLLGRSRQGHPYDRFRNRVMFPIHDERGRVVGFGGRILPGFESETEPKYVNSPESPVFNKRRLLFGLWHARQSRARELLVMEGYTDVIAAQLAGAAGAVATLGTSLTTEHATLIRRFAPDGVTLVFDGDAAGRRAAERAFHALAPEVVPARISLLGEGEDPADVVQQGGRAGLDDLLGRAEDALGVFVGLLDARLDLATPEGKAQAVEQCVDLLAGIGDRFRRQDLLRRLAAALFLPPDLLEAGIRGRSRRARKPAAPAAAAAAAAPEQKARDTLLAALLADPAMLAELTETWPGEEACFPDPAARGLVADLTAWFLREGAFPAPAALLKRWLTLAGDDSETAWILRLEERSRTIQDPAEAVRDGVEFLRKRLLRADYDRLRETYRRVLRVGKQAAAKELEAQLAEAARRLAGA